MIRFHDEALNELNGAFDWYLARSHAAAERFEASLAKSIHAIATDPKRFAVLHQDVSYARVSGFPFIVIFQLRPAYTMVLAIAHTSRRDQYWQDRS